MARKRLYITVINDLSGDQRVHRIATSLTDQGFEVHVVGRILPHSLPLSERPYQTHRLRLLFTKGKWFYLFYNLRLFFFFLFRKVDVINACDLDTLLAGYLASTLKGIPLVYDSHEYFTEVPELVHRPTTQQIWLRLERWIFPKLKHAYTVNSSIADIYTNTYGVKVEVIRNLPFARQKNHPSSSLQGFPIIIYQGALNVGRGIDLMIEAMQHLENYTLWIVGRGDVEEELKKKVKDSGLEERVIFKGFVPLEQLYTLTSQASLGLSLEENLGKNYYYASPNKVYDYIQARIPVLVSNLPEMRKTVEEWGVGEVLTEAERDSWQLSQRIIRLLEKESETKTYSRASEIAAGTLNWEMEQVQLRKIYAPFIEN
ncbi:MAG: glycosyltransferase [Bacteroidota bacterium]